MPYAFTLDSPVPLEIFKQVNGKARAELGGVKPEGLIAHVAYPIDGVVRHVDVWESRAAWEGFEAVLLPFIIEAAKATGASPAGAVFTEIDVIDTWIGKGTNTGFGFVERVPATPEMYAEIKAKLGDTPPEGLVMHVAHVVDGGIEYTDVWESDALWHRWKNVTLVPVVTGVLAGYGIAHTEEGVTWDYIDVADVWL